MLKNYIGISRDHSGSMFHLRGAAARDYNSNVDAIKANSEKEKQDTIVSVVKCGSNAIPTSGRDSRGRYTGKPGINHGVNGVVREVSNSSVSRLKKLEESEYDANYGSTPLFDSVGDLIEQLESVPDANEPTVSFLIMVITDGGENSSKRWNATTLSQKIRQLQATDRWTFVFRVPRGYSSNLTRLGIPAGNILEWDQTEQGVEVATRATEQAVSTYYAARSRGATMTKSFYTTDLTEVRASTVKSKLVDISRDVQFFNVHSSEQIRPFVERQTGTSMVRGGAFYQLTKKEDEVQDYKIIAIRDKKTGHVYSGVEARNLLGLPHNGTVKIAPGNHGNYDIFIQSTSVNRKLMPGTQVMYWPKVGVPYQS